MASKSSSGVGSVDRALQVLLLLGEQDAVRVIDVAEHLGVARSTAHRLLTALLQRGFVHQGADKVYRRGPAFTDAGFGSEGLWLLRSVVRPHMEALSAGVRETCHLVVLEGNGARFLDAVESERILRVRDRTGLLLEAHSTAAGKALLATLSDRDLFALYPLGVPGSNAQAEVVRRKTLQEELAVVRQRGYATNFEEMEPGVTAVAAAFLDRSGQILASLAVACPSVRCPRSRVVALAEAVRKAINAVTRDLDAVALNKATH
ncbi:IclR family transcriptional regulator [Streptomyces sp. NPDC054919]